MKYGFHSEDLIINTTAQVKNRKGIKEIVSAFHTVMKELNIDHLKLLIVGYINKESTYVSDLNEYIKQNKLENHITMTDTVDNPNIYFQMSDIFVFASKLEGFPNACLEAMSSGLPIIMKELPGVSEYIVKNNKNGNIFNDQERFVKYLKKLILSKDLRLNYGQKSRKIALERYDYPIISSQLLNRFEN